MQNFRLSAGTSPEKLSAYKDPVAVFGNGEEMIRSGSIDAVLVATPHYQHTSLGICAIENGIHLMVEKPICPQGRCRTFD